MLRSCLTRRCAAPAGSYAFAFAPTCVPIFGAGGKSFPVRRVYCVGQNYASHAAEMGNKSKAPPFFFTKPADAVVPQSDPDAPIHIAFPIGTKNYQHEVELVVAIGKELVVPPGAEDARRSALGCILGYGVGLDMTRRDLQAEAKANGRPWDLAKGADSSAPLSILRPVSDIGHPTQGSISLFLNDVPAQQGNLQEMLWSVPDILLQLSQYVRLRPGDLIFTGTPAGVSSVKPGDAMEAVVEGVGRVTVHLD